MKKDNKFFDINQLPQEEGIILMGISMNKIGNAQSPAKCFEYLQWFDTKIRKTEGIGMVVLYADYLYFHSDEKASVLRDRYKQLMLSHKNGFLNILSKDNNWIKKAFSFYTFGQLMLDNSESFGSAWTKILELYETDVEFQKHVQTDCLSVNTEVTERGVLFILEEITAFYLSAKGQLSFNNRFVTGTETWVLPVYPGKPLKSEVYLFKKNPLKLENPQNKYNNHFYDLEENILYDYKKVIL